MIFAPDSSNAPTGADWVLRNNGFPYDPNRLNQMQDPDGNRASHQITSIPSPFARIDLVKTAFRRVCEMARDPQNPIPLTGKTIFHRMVSDSLDVGEIFFNYEKYNSFISIVRVDLNNCIQTLKGSLVNGHKVLGEALDTVLTTDGHAYNLNQTQNCIYALNYLPGPNAQGLNVIGATSPATLFFSNANDLPYVLHKIQFANGDLPFDANYQPLYKRDPQYILAWFQFKFQIDSQNAPGTFSSLFPEVDDYLGLTSQNIKNNKLRQALQGMNMQSALGFNNINVNGNLVEVLGYPLYGKQNSAQAINQTSEFVIKATLNTGGNAPLVLPIGGNKYSNLHYVAGPWGGNNAPVQDNTPIQNRTLPQDGTKYPYLTISDFLEDYAVKVPYSLNGNDFFDGNVAGIGNNEALSYLLPIKPLFFRFFTATDLVQGVNGMKMIEMKRGNVTNSLTVTLRIPINGNGSTQFVEYERTYYDNNVPKISAQDNDGGMAQHDFTGLVMPMVASGSEARYVVASVHATNTIVQISAFAGEQVVASQTFKRHSDSQIHRFVAETQTIRSNFDYLRVTSGLGQTSGLLLPIFRKPVELTGQPLNFAVDMGTCNTHIAWKNPRSGVVEPINYDENYAPYSVFFKQVNVHGALSGMFDELELIEKDFLPKTLGIDDRRFPTRTALSYSKSIDWSSINKPFEMYNLPLSYGKRRDLPYNNVELDIKWANDNDKNNDKNKKIVEAYIRSILMIIRNTVVTEGGDLSNVNLTWFYPASMSPAKVDSLTTSWKTLFDELYGTDSHVTRLHSVSESIAPVWYHIANNLGADTSVSIDIGGGTTDVAYASGENIDFITSFRFAGNALFETPFAPANNRNGIIDCYKPRFADLMRERARELVGVFNSGSNCRPANMASFLFSLADNAMLANTSNSDKNFNDMLSDDGDFKLAFVLFYCAIVYHIARIVNIKGLPIPRHVIFSGNGSKLLHIISRKTQRLEDLTKRVFGFVFGSEPDILNIVGLSSKDKPKEYTCMGALNHQPVAEADDDFKKLVFYSGFGDSIETPDYSSITEGNKESVLAEVRRFMGFMLSPDMIDWLEKYIGVSMLSVNEAKDYDQDLLTYLNNGIDVAKSEFGINEAEGERMKLSETLFFYPLKGIISEFERRVKENVKTQL